MSEATIDTTQAAEVAALQRAAREIDRARMKQIGSFHFAMVMGALTLWGAALTWARVTGWGVGHIASVANALVAGFVIAPTIHAGPGSTRSPSGAPHTSATGRAQSLSTSRSPTRSPSSALPRGPSSRPCTRSSRSNWEKGAGATGP